MAPTRLALIVIVCSGSVLCAQQLDSARPAIQAYRAAIQAARQEPSRGRLEGAFRQITALREALLSRRDGGGSVLESLSEPEFAALGRELIGLDINREEIVYVGPNVVFFRNLAARGDRADRAFFAALGSTYPRSVFPVYVEPQTDYSGCTRFGSGTLVSTYATWVAFRRQYPMRYEEASRSHLEEVTGALTESTCACGDHASVEKELTDFSRRISGPDDVRPAVEARLAAVRANRANIRFTCISG